MDIVAHGLWAGLGVAWARRRWPIAPRTAAATIVLAVAPDLVQLLPLLGRAGVTGDVDVLLADATAGPGQEPVLTPMLALTLGWLWVGWVRRRAVGGTGASANSA